MQSCATILSPDHYLGILLDRFELTTVLAPKPVLQYENAQTVVLLEEFLNFLIQLLTDRSKVSLLTIEQQTRQEIIQAL
jgi:hypothetical protein